MAEPERAEREPEHPEPDDQAAARPPNMAAQHLRSAIDSGRTGDKIPVEDPAASPLGTDDEAAGRRPPPSPSPIPASPSVAPPPGHAKGNELPGGKAIGIGVIAGVVAIVLVLLVVAVAG